MSNVVPLGKAAKKVVADLGLRVVSSEGRPPEGSVLAWSQLRGSVAHLGACGQSDETAWQEYRRLEVIRGKNRITEGLALIQKNESADAAIKHLRDLVAAIGGESTVGSEEH